MIEFQTTCPRGRRRPSWTPHAPEAGSGATREGAGGDPAKAYTVIRGCVGWESVISVSVPSKRVYAEGEILDLEHLALSSGQARALDLEVGLDPIELGGQTYTPAGGGTEARLDVSRTSSGYALRIRFSTQLTGPCVRCLEEAATDLEIDAREVDQPPSTDEELRSPYVSEGELEVGRWANDALVLAFPAQPICRDDCAGLCAVCGESLNDADPEAHRHSQGGDPRMAKLRDLKLD
jgi:uncharacterized protein